MWRACFLAIGVYLIVFGLECLAVERVYFRLHEDPPKAVSLLDNAPKVGPQKQFTPAPWVPWSLLSVGVVVCVYSFTIPRRIAGK